MEIWKDIQGYEGLYQVSSLGRIKSNHKGYETILKNTGKEYFGIKLCKNGVQKDFRIHRLVAETFIINSKNYECVNHKDENKHNNNVNNLEWCTKIYNERYGTRNIRGSKTKSKYKIMQLDLNNNLIKIWDCMIELCLDTKYKNYNIRNCCIGITKSAYSYKWKYILK